MTFLFDFSGLGSETWGLLILDLDPAELSVLLELEGRSGANGSDTEDGRKSTTFRSIGVIERFCRVGYPTFLEAVGKN